MTDEGANLAETIVYWRAAWLKGGIINEVNVPHDVKEPISRYPFRDRAVVQVLVGLPVILDGRELADTHQDGKTQKGFHLIHCNLRPLSELFIPHDLFCISIALRHHLLHQVISRSLGDSSRRTNW